MTPVPTITTVVASDELEKLIAQAKSMRQANQALVVQRIPGASPYVALLEYREAGTPPMVHENDSEIFYVVEGSGTMMLGGRLLEERRVHFSISASGEPIVDEADPEKQSSSPHLMGRTAEGGSVFRISKGDLVIVPPHTVHWFDSIDEALSMVSIHGDLVAR